MRLATEAHTERLSGSLTEGDVVESNLIMSVINTGSTISAILELIVAGIGFAALLLFHREDWPDENSFVYMTLTQRHITRFMSGLMFFVGTVGLDWFTDLEFHWIVLVSIAITAVVTLLMYHVFLLPRFYRATNDR